jgi:hypothetical protein
MTIHNDPATRLAGTLLVASALVFGLAGCPGPSNMDASPEGGDASDVIRPNDGGDTVDVPTDSPPDVTDGGSTTPTTATMVVACGTVCTHPLDAVPSSDGSTIYFTAFNADGLGSVYSVPATGGTITPIAPGAFEYPVAIAISNDGNTLFVADAAAIRGTQGAVGEVFSLGVSSGTPTPLHLDMSLIRPSALTVSADGMNLLVSGIRASDEQPSVFQVSIAGGSATALATDLADPSGISIAPDGTTIVHDTIRTGERSASAVRIMGSSTTPQTSGLVAGYPAGLAFSTDGTGVLLSGSLGGTGGLITWAPMGGGSPSNPAALSTGMVQPLGLHRARMQNVWAVADDQAGGGNGAIFLVH